MALLCLDNRQLLAQPATPRPIGPERAPLSYTPQHLAAKIPTARRALEGERKQVTVLFADSKDSTDLIKDLDPEEAHMQRSTEEVRRTHGLEMRLRVGLNAGEVVVRTIGNDLHMDYSAVGPTTHLAARRVWHPSKSSSLRGPRGILFS